MRRSRSVYKAAIPALKKDVAAAEKKLTLLKSALLTMEALAEGDGGDEQRERPVVLIPAAPNGSTQTKLGRPRSTQTTQTKPGRPRTGSKTTIDIVEEIVRAANRPMHAVREIQPALEERGLGYKHEASLISSMRKCGRFERTAPGTYALKGTGKEGRAKFAS